MADVEIVGVPEDDEIAALKRQLVAKAEALDASAKSIAELTLERDQWRRKYADTNETKFNLQGREMAYLECIEKLLDKI